MADLATLNDLAIRLGRTSEDELTDAQRAQGELLLALASALIRSTAGKLASWEPEAGTVAVIIMRAVCLEVCVRVMVNPAGVRSESETLGAHQHAVSYVDGHSDLWLTDREAGLVRDTAWATDSATTIPATTVDLLIELAETGEMTV